MTEFHVEYRIEVEADSAEEAAQKVADILGDGGAARGAYHVRPHPPQPEVSEVLVDLEEAACARHLALYRTLAPKMRAELTAAVLEDGHLYPYSSGRWSYREQNRHGARGVHAITISRLRALALIEWDRFGYVPTSFGVHVVRAAHPADT